jgi:crotonobetainyl-CoA:carnitine CoA-transferase CaiB-like acyl-CoA transferase
VKANGLVQQIWQPGLGVVSLLGSLFKTDGATVATRRPAPARGEHTEEILAELVPADVDVPV